MSKPAKTKFEQIDEIARIKTGVSDFLAHTTERTNVFHLAKELNCSPQKLSAVLTNMQRNSSLLVRLRIKYRIYHGKI